MWTHTATPLLISHLDALVAEKSAARAFGVGSRSLKGLRLVVVLFAVLFFLLKILKEETGYVLCTVWERDSRRRIRCPRASRARCRISDRRRRRRKRTGRSKMSVSCFVDEQEEQKAVIGGGYLNNMLHSGVFLFAVVMVSSYNRPLFVLLLGVFIIAAVLFSLLFVLTKKTI